MYNEKIVIPIVLMLFALGCSSSDENLEQTNSGRQEINDLSVGTADVNSEEYWSNAKLVWSDEFDGETLSKENWFIETSIAGVGYPGLQNFTGEGNIRVSDGTLKIISKKIGSDQGEGDYSSARINSALAFTYGKLEIRAKLPEENGSGLWSKLFLLGNNIGTVGYPRCGQVSFMEYVSHVPNQFFNTVHNADNVGAGSRVAANSGFISLETAEEEFHLYGVLWTDRYLKFYVDDIDNIVFSFDRPTSFTEDNWPFSNSFYFVMDTAVGGEFSDSNGVEDANFPATFEIDYVRVYHAQ